MLDSLRQAKSTYSHKISGVPIVVSKDIWFFDPYSNLRSLSLSFFLRDLRVQNSFRNSFFSKKRSVSNSTVLVVYTHEYEIE